MNRAARAKQERGEREAAWEAEQARVKALGDLFAALPEGHQKAALLDAMTDRIIHLYNECRHEQGDTILEFLPNDYAHELLDWYFDENGPDTFSSKTATADYEITQPREIQGGTQQPSGPDGQHSEQADALHDALSQMVGWAEDGTPDEGRQFVLTEARAALKGIRIVPKKSEIVEIAKDLVALWQSPKIQGLPRADRNAAIEETRNRMIEAVRSVTNGERQK